MAVQIHASYHRGKSNLPVHRSAQQIPHFPDYFYNNSMQIHTASGLYLPVCEVEASHTDMQIPEVVSAWSQTGSFRVEPEQ